MTFSSDTDTWYCPVTWLWGAMCHNKDMICGNQKFFANKIKNKLKLKLKKITYWHVARH